MDIECRLHVYCLNKKKLYLEIYVCDLKKGNIHIDLGYQRSHFIGNIFYKVQILLRRPG